MPGFGGSNPPAPAKYFEPFSFSKRIRKSQNSAVFTNVDSLDFRDLSPKYHSKREKLQEKLQDKKIRE
jgi:hypothetical protein